MKCPICDTEMNVRNYYTDIGLGYNCGPLEESYEHCPNGCWNYEFSFGSSSLSIRLPDTINPVPDFEINWYYTEKSVHAELREKMIKSICEYARGIFETRPS